jgi:hypothetical protein
VVNFGELVPAVTPANVCAPVKIVASGLIAGTATVHVTAQCGCSTTVVSHEQLESASHAAAAVSAEHFDQSPASPHVDCGIGSGYTV